MPTVQDSLLCFILFDSILNIPVNNFSVMSAHSTKINVSSIIPMMDKTQVNSDCEFYDIYRLLIFLTKCGPYDAMAPSQNY